MNDELRMDTSSLCINQYEDAPRKGLTVPQNITVILPAYNEQDLIGSVILLTKTYADNVIVVDDGSSDKTAEIARQAGVEVVIHETNKGKGGALKTGFMVAANHGADIIVTMDSDGQHDPAEIPKLIAPIIKGEAEMVNGSRYLNGHETNTPKYRRFGQAVLDELTNISSGLEITDSQSGFRAFAASITDVFRFNAQGMAIESEMLADAAKSGVRIKEVDIGVRYDVEGSTINPIKHGLIVLLKVLREIEFNKPLYCFTLPGLVLGLGGLIMGTYFLQTYTVGGGLNFGPTILMVLLLVVGTFMSLTGLLLHSISTLIRETRFS